MSDPRKETGQRLCELAEWSSNIAFEDIPHQVLKKTVFVIADDLAAMIAAREEPEVARLHDQMLKRPVRAEATVFRGGRPRTDRYSAAVANAIAANWCELDEGFRKVASHPGIYVLPGLLADAEAEGLSVADVLRSTVLAYEIVGRMAQAFYFPSPLVHCHARYAALGAAAALGFARRLDQKQLLDALTAATTLSLVGPQNHVIKGALIENAWAGIGVEAGMHCADWAPMGIGGLPDSPYDVYVEALGSEYHPECLTEQIGSDWAIMYGFHKPYATCGRTHAAVEATLAMLDELPSGKAVELIEHVELDVHDPQLSNYEPPTTLAARFSFPQVIAAVLEYRHANVDAFSALALEKPEIAELRRKIEIRPYEPPQPWPRDRAARVKIRLKNGKILSHEIGIARGSPDNPLSDEEIWRKVAGLAGAVYPRLMPVMSRLADLEEPLISQRWDILVEDFVSHKSNQF